MGVYILLNSLGRLLAQSYAKLLQSNSLEAGEWQYLLCMQKIPGSIPGIAC